MTTVLKLGGSVITEKDRTETVDVANLGAAVEALAGREDVVVIHGGGSFGHHHAAEHGVSATEGTHDGEAIRAIHEAMKRLNTAVVEGLSGEGTPALPVHPLSVASRDADGNLHAPTAHVETMLAEGFVPVLHGDVIVHAEKGATILSGDELVVALASALDADRVGVCSAVPGVYDESGEVISHIDSFEAVADALGGSDETDVTGGMAGKVRQLLELDAEAYVFGIDGLDAFLDGRQPGTRIS